MTEPLSILIVDDSPEDREIYRRLLAQDREHVWTFRETELGEEGLCLARAAAPDCILLDYRLPDLDGVEFLVQLAAAGIACPVIVLTGQGSEEVAVQAMKSGAQDYLIKDALTREGLARAVLHAIERVALRHKVEERPSELEREIGERRRAEEALQKMYAELENLVHHRTVELSIANLELKREIRERERAEREKAELLVREQVARRQAEEANRTKDEFLATLSHELRTPLNAMLGWAQLLRTGNLDAATAARALETIERNARSQAQLISDLLDVSRIITGKLRLELQPIELPLVLEAVLDTVRPAADAKGLQLAVRVDPLVPALRGDADRIQQVIWNLVSNAIKFTPAGGRVEVELGRRPDLVELAVRDTGIGIRPDFLPYVFDRFRQAESAITRTHGGLGLGLSIVRHLVELHGGTVAVASPGEGRGATFTVRLPAQGTAPDLPRHEPAAAGGAGERPRLDGLHVLVVDDEADARELTARMLGGAGARVTAAASAAAALGALEGELPDVLVVDLGMPGEDGYALLRQVRALPAARGGALPAAALTAYARAEDRARALAAGFQIHLAKPVDPPELVAAVAGLAAGPSSRRAADGLL
jgi:signal transduction histidine kinase